MNSVPKKLKIAFDNILNCELVKTKIITNDNLIEFQQILNTTIPKGTDYKLYRFIKELSKKPSCNFGTFVFDYNCRELYLWSNLSVLLYYLELHNIIFIKHNYYYNPNNNIKKILHSYTVTKYQNKEDKKETKLEIKSILKRPNNETKEKKMDIKSILHNYDEQLKNKQLKEKQQQIINEEVNYKYSTDIQKNALIDLDVYEEEYFAEDARMWDRRNKLRENLKYEV